MQKISLLLTLFNISCAYNHKILPDSHVPIASAAASQQEAIVSTVDEAIKQLEFGEILHDGRAIEVVVIGVYSPSESQLLAYVRSEIEKKLLLAGASLCDDVKTATSQPDSFPTDLENGCKKLTVNVRVSGMDVFEKSELNTNTLLIELIPVVAAPILVGTLGFFVGLVVANIQGEVGIPSDATQEEHDALVRAAKDKFNNTILYGALGGIVTGVPIGLLTSTVWATLFPPMDRTTELAYRTELSVHSIAEGRIFESGGKSSTTTIIRYSDPMSPLLRKDILDID